MTDIRSEIPAVRELDSDAEAYRAVATAVVHPANVYCNDSG